MSRTLQALRFLSVILLILGGVHYYLWARLIRDTHLPSPWPRVGTVLIILGALSIPSAAVLLRLFQRPWGTPIYVGALLWFAVAGLLVTFFAASDLVRLIASAIAWVSGVSATFGVPVDPSRRLLLARALAGSAGATVASMVAVGTRNATGEVQVKEVPVKLARLPKELSGLTLVQITDVHVGPSIGKAFVDHVVEKINAMKPDLIAITGDLVDGRVETLRESVSPLTRLKSRYGSFFVTGNHEYYSGVEEWNEELIRMGIRVLNNERVMIGDAGASFDLAGVPDYTAKQPRPFGTQSAATQAPDIAKTLEGRDPDREVVLLAHQPKAISEAAAHDVGLVLSGHTHGGQVWPFAVLVGLTQPFIAGFHRRENTSIYVSCGTGYWGPPMRIGAPAEITRIVLT